MFARGGIVLCLVACKHPADPENGGSPPGDPPEDTGELTTGGTLPIRHVADPAAAERGRAFFEETSIASPTLPVFGFRSLWLVWGTGTIADDVEYWAAFRARYGMIEAPYENSGYPTGLRVQDGLAILDCYTCHVSEVAGVPVIGVANSTFDMEGLYDDLASLASMTGIPVPGMDQGTGASGANDAWGLGIQLVNDLEPNPEANLHFGYQRPSAWWTLKYKDRMYADGSAGVDGHRTMMAMLLAYGVSLEEAAALEPNFQDVQHYLWSLEAPAWPFDAPDGAAVDRGRAVFDGTCARCHGVHSGPDAAYPDLIVPLEEVGTDPLRAANFRDIEAEWLSDFMATAFASEPLEASGGYLAPPLVGIWARAPYFHDASVPDLASVVDSPSRPDLWQRTGTGAEDYDVARVGWRYEVPASPLDATTIEGRRIHDSSRPGLSNEGHTFGDALSDDERADLLAYLITL